MLGTGGPESAQDTPRPSSQHKGDVFAPEGQRAWIMDKDKRWGIGEKGKEQKGEGHGLPQNREEADVVDRQTAGL